MTEAKKILSQLQESEPGVEEIRAKNPNRVVHDVGSLVQWNHRLGSLARLHDGETGKVVRVEDHGAGQIAHYVMWPRKRKPEMHWGGCLVQKPADQ